MTKDEALRMALEFAEYCIEELDLSYMASNQAKRLMDKTKEALAQPEQEPVAWQLLFDDGHTEITTRPVANWKRLMWESAGKRWDTLPLYTTPPQRTEQEQQIETLKRCLFQMQEAAKDLVEQAKSLNPPQRTWVGLTNKEIWTVLQFRGYSTDTIEIAKAIEAKLKEKNT